jgi:predicted dehydrogenase
MGPHMTTPALRHEPAYCARLGFLGVGWMGQKRLDALAKSRAIDIAAVCDPARDRVARARALATGAAACGSIEEMLDWNLDGVVICSPGTLQVRQALDCLEWGLPVFCQKPFAATAREATAVVLEAQTQDCLIDVDLCYRRLAAVEAIMDLAGSGELGEIHAARLVFHNAHGPDQAWFHDPKLTGGGCVVDLATHLIDLAVRVLGSPVVDVESACFKDGQPLARPIRQIEDYATARLRLSSGALVDLACSWRIALGRDAVIDAEFFGTRGEARLRNVDGSFYDFTAVHTQGSRSRMLVEPPDEWRARSLESWAKRLAEGDGFDCSAWELVHLSRVVDQIYGRQQGVRVEDFDATPTLATIDPAAATPLGPYPLGE